MDRRPKRLTSLDYSTLRSAPAVLVRPFYRRGKPWAYLTPLSQEGEVLDGRLVFEMPLDAVLRLGKRLVPAAGQHQTLEEALAYLRKEV